MKNCINLLKKIFKKINCLLIPYKRVRALEGEFVKSPKEEQTFPFKDIHDDFIEVKDKMKQPLAYLAKEIGAIIYYNQSIKQHDASGLMSRKLLDMWIKKLGISRQEYSSSGS